MQAGDDVARRRAKQIGALNPGHTEQAIAEAVRAEAEAAAALARTGIEGRKQARLHLRACQIRSTNLDLSYVEASDRARAQLAAEAQGGV